MQLTHIMDLLAQVAAEIPYIVIQPLIFSAIVYPMVGFQMTFEKFIWFVMYMILSFMDYTLYGMMAVALTPSPEIAAGLSFLIFMIWYFFSGFIITRKVIDSFNSFSLRNFDRRMDVSVYDALPLTFTGDAHVVEVDVLGRSSSMDPIWACVFTARRPHGTNPCVGPARPTSDEVFGGVLRP